MARVLPYEGLVLIKIQLGESGFGGNRTPRATLGSRVVMRGSAALRNCFSPFSQRFQTLMHMHVGARNPFGFLFETVCIGVVAATQLR
jgi:hypothetical protein